MMSGAYRIMLLERKGVHRFQGVAGDGFGVGSEEFGFRIAVFGFVFQEAHLMVLCLWGFPRFR